ncbi:MAG: hypothetical protein AAGC46_05315 [Solirubrobacteraceae bacterium]|nr:hypothetical protein [Patulibacter sp.]
MKSPTTHLVERAVAKQEHDPAADLAHHRAAAAEQFDGPFIDACLFSRRWNAGSQLVARQFGILGRLALRKARELQAAGLPNHFMLVITDTEVIAFERELTPFGGQLGKPGRGGEVARWRRADLTVTWTDAGYLYDTVIASRTEGEVVKCTVGKAPISESFLRLLADPTATAPASTRAAA